MRSTYFKILLFISILLPTKGHSGVDFKYGGSLRSFPSIGGAIEANLGYSQPLWGAQGSPFSGLIRPSINTTHTVVVNDYDAALTFYPVSFIGIYGGHKELYSRYDSFTAHDCETTRCEGNMKKDYLGAKLAFAYKSFLATHSYTEFRNSYNDPTGAGLPVVEYEWVSEVNPNFENSIRKNYFAGLKLDNKDILGLAFDFREFEFSKEFYKFSALIYQMSVSNVNIVMGVGSQESKVSGAGTVLILRVTHVLLPSLNAF